MRHSSDLQGTPRADAVEPIESLGATLSHAELEQVSGGRGFGGSAIASASNSNVVTVSNIR